MLFSEFQFFPFLVAALGGYWAFPCNTWRKWWLLAFSYLFYAGWDWRFLGLIVFSTVLDYWVARRIEASEREEKRKRFLYLSLLGNLGSLAFFKYYGFFTESAVAFSEYLGLGLSPPILKIVLPVGISFYTFQTLSYTIDVYRRRIRAEESLLDVAVFVAFFPQLVAGPIVRAADFLPQLQGRRSPRDVNLPAAMTLFVVGFVKKVCVADVLAPYVDRFFSQPSAFSVVDSWLGVIAYAIQIYCDFSGYSDMAIATSAFFGYRLCLNFDFPYLSTNITDFWRRWHISLSGWLRDYLYISLGGNRQGTMKTYRNLFLTMLLGGLWHGAAWTFVVWGAMHGVALAAHKYWVSRFPLRASVWTGLFGWALTMLVVLIAWVFFRAPDFGTTLVALHSMVGGGDGTKTLLDGVLLFVIGAFAVGHVRAARFSDASFVESRSPYLVAAACAVVLILAYAVGPVDYTPFIYFQF